LTHKLNLAIDIGNTRTKLGFFEGEQLLRKAVLERLTVDALMEQLYNQNATDCILSSVGATDPEVVAFLKAQTTFVELNAETPLPIENDYATPQTLGKDRLAAAVGAWAFFPGQ
ncbi:type III pantothenate kinase, partial [Arthrospira platensis SPKY1]|nr:type III pantothenate kinase [Arthrospira platensis SPKY1]